MRGVSIEKQGSRLHSLRNRLWISKHNTPDLEASRQDSRKEEFVLYPKTTLSHQVTMKNHDSRASSKAGLDTILDMEELLKKNSAFMEYYNTKNCAQKPALKPKEVPKKGHFSASPLYMTKPLKPLH